MRKILKEYQSVCLRFQIIVCSLILSLNAGSLIAQSNIADVNGNGSIDIMIIGTSVSINSNYDAFSPDQIAVELQNIIASDSTVGSALNIQSEDIYRTKNVTTGIANVFSSELDYYCHSLVQYYYWPEDRSDRIDNLLGLGNFDWDYVVISGDPYMISNIPGYHSLGVNKIARKVFEGGAVPLLLMPWEKNLSSLSHFEEFTYRTADGCEIPLENIPAGLAWNELPSSKQDIASFQPTPNGAYLSAASVYSHIFNRSASFSLYTYDDEIADIAHSTNIDALNQTHYSGPRSFISPYKSCDITDSLLIYNHGGTSTEYGIFTGIEWAVALDQKTLEFSSSPPIHFNYGRSSMGTTHLYVVDPAQFDFSFGYPLQDDMSTGLETMQFGIDQRVDENDVETDLGVVQQMVNNSELPYARNVPLRTIISQMIEEIPGVQIYPTGDPWHMSGDVNKAIGSFMYTLLTSDCALANYPEPTDSVEWRTWMAHKVGYSIAWNLMYLEGFTPCYSSIVGIAEESKENPTCSVYPNPSSGNFRINFKESSGSKMIRVLDLMGRRVLEKEIDDMKYFDFSITQEHNGIYMLIVENEGVKSVIKLIKKD